MGFPLPECMSFAMPWGARSLMQPQADAVAAAAAAAQGVSKADVVGADASDAAVRLALAETAVIAETKRFLEEVRLSELESRVGR